MPDLQWIKLENFIPRDVLEHTRLLRRNFTRMNQFVQESPAGAVPNYYYNVLSQQYMALSEKLLVEPTDAELDGLDLRAKVLVTARFAVQEELNLKLKEEETTSQSDARFSPDGDKAVENTSPKPIASPPQELEVSSVPQDIDLGIEQDEGIHIILPSTTPGFVSTTQLGPIHKPKTEKVSNKPQDVILIRVKLPSTTLDSTSTTRLILTPKGEKMFGMPKKFSMPQDADLDTEQEEGIHVKLPSTTLGIGSTQLGTTDVSETGNTSMSQKGTDNDSSSRSGSVPVTSKMGYWVEMQNVRPMIMHIRNKAEKYRALKKILAENRERISCIRQLQDITYIGWIRHDSPEKLVSAVLVEFSTAQQANEAINIGIAYEGFIFDCRKYHRDCKPVQCLRCQAYGHAHTTCTSLQRCAICNGQHSAINCSSTIELCALCGGGHRADTLSCPKLAAEISRVRQALNEDRSRLWPSGSGTIKEVSRADSKSDEAALLPQPDHPTPRPAPNRTPPGLSFEQFLSKTKAACVARKARSQAADLTLRGGSQTRARDARAIKRANVRALKIDSYLTETVTTKERRQAVSRNPPKAENMAKSSRGIRRPHARALKINSRPTRTVTAKEPLEVVGGKPAEAEKISGRGRRSDSKSPGTEEFQENLNTIAKPSSFLDKPTIVVPVNSWDATAADEEINW